MTRQKPTRVPIAASVAAIALVASAAPAFGSVDVTLDFSTLPSAQGWSYYTDTATPETSVFSVDGGQLTMNSASANAAYYHLDDIVDPTLSFELEMRTRVFGGGGNYMDFYFGTGSAGGVIALSPTSIVVLNATGNFEFLAAIDNTVMRDYRVLGDFVSGYTILVDGVAVGTGELYLGLMTNPFAFGDGGGLGGGSAELASFSFRQPVPEPGTYSLLLGGLVFLGVAARLRRQR